METSWPRQGLTDWLGGGSGMWIHDVGTLGVSSAQLGIPAVLTSGS